jgi:hypothetical protein
MDPSTAARINAKVDEITDRIDRLAAARKAGHERLVAEQAEREIARRERRTEIQADAAALYDRWRSAPPIPVADEAPSHYRRRVLRNMQEHLPPGSPFSALRLSKLPSDRDALHVIAPRIEAAFGDAYNDPATVPEGTFREIKGETTGGHKTSSFIGRRSFIADMSMPCAKVVGGVEGLRRNVDALIRQR